MKEKIVRNLEVQSPLIHKAINKTPVNKDSIEGMNKDTDHMVKGTFVNIECPGQPAKISCKIYKGMQYFSKLFQDNELTTIPLSVARFINERIIFDEHSHILDDKGNPVKNLKPRARYKFIIEAHLAA